MKRLLLAVTVLAMSAPASAAFWSFLSWRPFPWIVDR